MMHMEVTGCPVWPRMVSVYVSFSGTKINYVPFSLKCYMVTPWIVHGHFMGKIQLG